MATSSVRDFLTRVGQGVKPNLFEVDINFPTGASLGITAADQELTDLLCKSAALPASNLGFIEVPFRGRTVKIAGDRTFDTWTATFINDSQFRIRRSMEKWMEAINKHEQNSATLSLPGAGSAGYTANIFVKQLARDAAPGGKVITTYKLWDCFPTNISQIDLAYDSNDQIEDFTVEFQVQYWSRGDTDGLVAEDVIDGPA